MAYEDFFARTVRSALFFLIILTGLYLIFGFRASVFLLALCVGFLVFARICHRPVESLVGMTFIGAVIYRFLGGSGDIDPNSVLAAMTQLANIPK